LRQADVPSALSAAEGGLPLTARKRATSGSVRKSGKRTAAEVDFPFSESVGYQIRATHRALQRFLQLKIEPHGITLGMWYFLRALWHEDGLTQRELSRRVGTMEPTTLSAILIMEKKALVRRVRNKVDRRKWHIYLTTKGHALKAKLIPLARDVVDIAVQNLSQREVKRLLEGLALVQKSLNATLAQFDETASKAAE
jgi:MarR family transcriptional regulator, organic hydroperoxide resistance regulator